MKTHENILKEQFDSNEWNDFMGILTADQMDSLMQAMKITAEQAFISARLINKHNKNHVYRTWLKGGKVICTDCGEDLSDNEKVKYKLFADYLKQVDGTQIAQKNEFVIPFPL